jgi:hypothetical protein
VGPGTGLRVAADVAELLTPADLDTLRRSAATGYRCVACDQPGELGAEPAAVVILVAGVPGGGPDGPQVAHVQVAHERCSPSQVITDPGILVPPETTMTATAAVIPHASGPRALLIAEPMVHLSSLTGSGEQVDPVIAGLLGSGLHLLATAGRRPPAAPDWSVQLPSPFGAVILEPSRELFYDGELVQPGLWREIVSTRGEVELLSGVIGLDAVGPGNPGEGLRLLADTARRGRLVGGTVRVDEQKAPASPPGHRRGGRAGNGRRDRGLRG